MDKEAQIKLMRFKLDLELVIAKHLESVSLSDIREFFGEEDIASIVHKVRC